MPVQRIDFASWLRITETIVVAPHLSFSTGIAVISARNPRCCLLQSIHIGNSCSLCAAMRPNKDLKSIQSRSMQSALTVGSFRLSTGLLLIYRTLFIAAPRKGSSKKCAKGSIRLAGGPQKKEPFCEFGVVKTEMSIMSGLGVNGWAVAMEMMVCSFGLCTISVTSFMWRLTIQIQAHVRKEARARLTIAVTRNQSGIQKKPARYNCGLRSKSRCHKSRGGCKTWLYLRDFCGWPFRDSFHWFLFCEATARSKKLAGFKSNFFNC